AMSNIKQQLGELGLVVRLIDWHRGTHHGRPLGGRVATLASWAPGTTTTQGANIRSRVYRPWGVNATNCQIGCETTLYGNEFNDLLDASPSITKKLLVALTERARANAT